MDPERPRRARPHFSIDLINASAVEAVSGDADPKTSLEEVSLDDARAQAILDSFKQDTQERKKYARLIFILTCCWISGIYLLLI